MGVMSPATFNTTVEATFCFTTTFERFPMSWCSCLPLPGLLLVGRKLLLHARCSDRLPRATRPEWELHMSPLLCRVTRFSSSKHVLKTHCPPRCTECLSRTPSDTPERCLPLGHAPVPEPSALVEEKSNARLMIDMKLTV
jgi:hypothetical protein